jgi:peptidoglycan/LPS O-acetylase OafA/YrhL
VRHPRSVRLARTRAQRWGLWIVLALLVLVPVAVCQAASSPAPVASSHAVTASCGGDLGHDVMCARGLAAAAMPGTRGGRDDGARDGIGVLVANVLVGAMAFAAGTGTPAGYGRTAGPPPWAPQRLMPSRRQLVAIGISRI